jgi:hypothetical protein
MPPQLEQATWLGVVPGSGAGSGVTDILTNGEPQLLQNFMPAGLTVPHFGHGKSLLFAGPGASGAAAVWG